MGVRSTLIASLALPSLALLLGCAAPVESSAFVRAEPEVNARIVERVPRTLRLFFEALPDVERSTVVLKGPEGEYLLRGLHSMGANDLMMEIYQPGVTNGIYTVEWSTVIAGDDARHHGIYRFEVAIP